MKHNERLRELMLRVFNKGLNPIQIYVHWSSNYSRHISLQDKRFEVVWILQGKEMEQAISRFFVVGINWNLFRLCVRRRKPTLLGGKILPDRWCKSCEMKHPATEFAHSRSRRCIPLNLIYEQNKREIQLERVRQWRAKKKAVQANNQRSNN